MRSTSRPFAKPKSTETTPASAVTARYRAVIVAPSLVRTIADANLLNIWMSALEALRRADQWIFAGYSLPSEDIAIRSILVRAYHGRGGVPRLPRVRVVQLAPDQGMERRYRLLFRMPPSSTGGFEQFIDALPDPPVHYMAQP